MSEFPSGARPVSRCGSHRHQGQAGRVNADRLRSRLEDPLNSNRHERPVRPIPNLRAEQPVSEFGEQDMATGGGTEPYI